MGNCQAAEAATVVIQHPEGRIQRLYWPTTAKEVMKCNPGHHVALVVTHRIAQEDQGDGGGGVAALRCTQVRLLKPDHMLLIGQVYRLITEQEATKAIKARKNEMLRRRQSELIKKHQEIEDTRSRTDEITQETSRESTHRRQKGTAGSATRTRQWHPALRSIAEDGVRLE
ncbi:uncharacterized protein M6B38_349270 [Iris pallida]|uniref:Uncharacterized protein n=1 Tax=Iris pallida TaxID=29817 RepID=A0AAX6GSN6_IRIPA|nr:Uncharacterized protein M6B38_234790 [Iris pallida]KAJ6831288.1 uncharacterized protein M6B38_349270 [Iris pallida]